jgi:hypothetical protein
MHSTYHVPNLLKLVTCAVFASAALAQAEEAKTDPSGT